MNVPHEPPRIGRQQYRLLFETNPNPVMAIDTEGNYVEANRAALAFLEVTAERLAGLNVRDFIPGDVDRDEFLALHRALWHTGGVIETAHQVGDRRKVLELAVTPLEVDGRRLVLGVGKDITEQLEFRRQLHLQSLVLDQIADHVAVTDLEGRITYLNQAELKRLGKSREELVGHAVHAFGGDAGRGATQDEIVRRTLEDGHWRGEAVNRDADGNAHVMDCRTRLIHDEDGRAVAICGIATDATERVEMEQHLRHSQKMEAVGQLAGGVAHDFNNQLGGILGYAQLLHQHLEEPRFRRWIESILVCTGRAGDLTRQLLAFARRGQYEHAPIDLHATIAEVAAILQHSIDRRIAVRQRLEAESAYTMGDGGQLQNALLNLGLNARDAMPGGGTLSFSTRLVSLGEDDCREAGAEMAPGRFVRIEVSDTGCGIDSGNLDRIFEPFYTTKQPGHGTGMGLAAVYGTACQHHGSVAVRSTPGEGTTFTLLFPLAENVSPAPLHAPPRVVPAPATAAILVVDDEQVIRNLARDLLSGLGYRVVLAPHGKAAVEVFQRRCAEIDLVLLDVVMPEMDGLATCRALKEIDPKVKVLVLSGISGSQQADRLLEQGALDTIAKPFTQAELSGKVARALTR